MSETKILLIRHGKTEANLEHRFQCSFDSPLSYIGKRQAELLGERLSSENIAVVYHSPMSRASETAKIAFGKRNVLFVKETSLMERGLGIFDGLKLEDAIKLSTDADALYHFTKEEVDEPSVEKFSLVKERSLSALKMIISANKGKTIAIVSHYFWINAALMQVSGMDFSELRKHSIATTSLTEIIAKDVSGGLSFRIEYIGDRQHLKGRPELDV